MDPFTQRMFEKAEQRSRAHGISNASKFPLADANVGDGDCSTELRQQQQQQQQQEMQMQMQMQMLKQHQQSEISNQFQAHASTGVSNKLQVVEKTPPIQMSNVTGGAGCMSPNKVFRQFAAVDKENMDLGIEINIMADKNVEVQVQVEEQEISDHDDEGTTGAQQNAPAMAKIRESSRNRLQRLGALYSNTKDLSSPIHRTEGQFHADSNEDAGPDSSPMKLQKQQRLGKLAALANTINQWEDDTTHHIPCKSVAAVPPPKPDLPSRPITGKKPMAPQPPTVGLKTKESQTKASQESEKRLKWDTKMMNSLEAQGFQRRESSTVKLAYEYSQQSAETQGSSMDSDLPTGNKNMPATSNSGISNDVEKKSDKPPVTVRPGLVSGRAAVFEHKANQQQQQLQQQQQKPQKDPTELSLKERRQLFERNKGEALLPKAAFAMAPPISKIRQDVVTALKKDEAARATTVSSTALKVNSNADSKVRDKVAALVANVSTASESKIISDMQKQRQEDMQLLANRFKKQKDIFSKEQIPEQNAPRVHEKTSVVRPPPPPPPPPPVSNTNTLHIKRRSLGNAIDDEENKRARKSQSASRLYPMLSDLESHESRAETEREHVNAGGTTPTASAHSTADEQEAHRLMAESPFDDEDSNDSYMDEKEDSSAGICNGSLGREIMQVVQKNDDRQRHQQKEQMRQVKEVRYAEKNCYIDDAWRGKNVDNGGEDSSVNSSEASMGVDELLDEALEDGDDDCTQGSDDEEGDANASGRSKGTTASNSFSFRKASNGKFITYQTIDEESNDQFQIAKSTRTQGGLLKQPVKSELTLNKDEDQNTVTLVHTVSFYRRQQNENSASSTPVRKITREEKVLRPLTLGTPVQFDATQSQLKQSTPYKETQFENSGCDKEYDDDDANENASDTEEGNEQLVQIKIQKLLEEVCKQQIVISQTSQALNLCAATVEFSGSTESVEGERHLLVATHRRQACLDEVQRLRVEKTLRPHGVTKERGRLTVKEITVPLRQDYIRKLATDTISGHHLVCLLKYNEHVLATRTVPTLPGLLAVKFPDVLQLNSVYADFRITLEIYGMTAQREILPHEVKYHINLNKKSGIKTPKRKGHDNRLVMPPVQSPAGPQAVRTPALVQYGFAIFSLREIQRTNWTLTQVLGVSPLDGVVHMKVNCELSICVEHKGFLTMFEDISGFGAWHRRWCHLNGTMLNYWKYPDDEKKRAPLGSIDLYTCTTKHVSTAPRDICARLHTMLVECQRPAKDTDQESLIIVPNGRTTTVRHLWSADTKEEREAWCAYLNKALTLLRAWGPPQ